MNDSGRNELTEIDRLSARNVALTILGVVILAVLGAAPFFFDQMAFVLVASLFGIGLFGLLVPYRMQVDVGRGSINVRTWWSVFRGDPGIERALGSEDRIVRYASGRIRLEGSDATAIPVEPWVHRRLLQACRRAGIQVEDRMVPYGLGRSALAVVVVFGLFWAITGGFAWWGPAWALFLLGREVAMRL
jgi:hypothetical protein